MFRKVLMLMTIVLGVSACEVQAIVYYSTWDGGGDAHNWSDPYNWDPNIVPDNGAGDSFVVTIDSDTVSYDSYLRIDLQQNRTINQLDCYGLAVELFNNTPDWIEFTMVDPNGLTNYGELDIEGEWRMQINGNVTNTAAKELWLWGMMEIVGNLYNSPDATVKAYGTDIGVDGIIANNGTIVITPETELWADDNFHNSGRIRIYGGQCQSDEIFDNNSTGVIQGFGVIWAEGLVRNKGEIYASGGPLMIVSEGSVTNTATLANKALSTLNIQTVEDMNNLGTIEVNAGGGVAFDCNLVNDTNGVIELLGGTLAATTITQSVDANFAGFGGITGDVVIDNNGIIELTSSTNIVGNVTIEGTLEISDGVTLITGQTICNGTIHIKGGYLIPQGGLSGDCDIIWEAGLFTNPADFNLDGEVNFGDFAYFAETWLWQTQLH